MTVLDSEIPDTLIETQEKLRRAFRVAFNGREPGEFEESMIQLASPRLTDGQPFHWTKKGTQPFLRFGLPEEQGDQALLQSDMLAVESENVRQAVTFAKEPTKDFISRVSAKEAHFCRLRAQGLSQASACIQAGWNPATPANAAVIGHEIEKRPHVKAYLMSLRTLEWKANVLSIEEKRAYLADVVRTPAGDVNEKSPLCQSYKVGTDGQIEYKLPDKLKALELDAKLAGELKEQATVNVGFAFGMLGDNVAEGVSGEILDVSAEEVPEKGQLPE